MDQAIVLGGRWRASQTSEQGLTHRLNRTRLDRKMDFQVLNLEDRGVRHAKSLPKWQAAKVPGRYSTIAGSSFTQMSLACGHLGWNRQPLGGERRLGGRPSIERSLFVSR